MPKLNALKQKVIKKVNTDFLRTVTIRNITLFIIAGLLYPIIYTSFSTITDQSVLETLMLFVGLIIVVPLFAFYEFTYESISFTSKTQNIMAHIFSSLIALAIFCLLAMIDVLFVMLVGNIIIFRFVVLLLALGILAYDFWDAYRFLNKEKN
jgi:hypothetical protein